MAKARLAMHKIREILRLKWADKRTHREIAQALRIGTATVSSVSVRAQKMGWSLEDVEALSNEELEVKLYGQRRVRGERPLPDCHWIHRELKRKYVTLELLHLEYLQEHPSGLKYSSSAFATGTGKRNSPGA